MLVVRLGFVLLADAYFLQFLLHRSMLFLLNFWDMAKLVRRLTLNQVSAGSSPAIPIKMNDEKISLLNAWEIFLFCGSFSSIFQYLRKIILIVGIGRKLLKMIGLILS